MYNLRFLVLAQEAQHINREEIALISYVIFALLLLFFMIILFFVTFQRRKHKLLLKQIEQQKAFDEEISRAQTEIQEQTLKHVGWELHDNVGQLLAYANMQLKVMTSKVPESLKPKMEDVSISVKESLKEVRSLSKSLNREVVLDMGFEASISNELDRLKRMKFSFAELVIKGDRRTITDKKHEIVLFRILQEFFSNAVKHSEAEELKVLINYEGNHLLITASDNGKGFDKSTLEKGSGLINMKSRAELIGATYKLTSNINEGVELNINYPFT